VATRATPILPSRSQYPSCKESKNVLSKNASKPLPISLRDEFSVVRGNDEVIACESSKILKLKI
jgi:hypothetical protein